MPSDMGYVIAAVIVVGLVAVFVTFLVINSTRKSDVSDAGDTGADQNSLGIIGSDRQTPVGDTTEHADPDGLNEGPSRDDRPDVARPVSGGEAEGRRSI
jgi:hypothetical protein